MDEPDLGLHLAQVLLASGVGEGVEHRHLVPVIADAQLNERRADEPGGTTDEQLHAVTSASSVMKSRRPACHDGSSGAPRSETRTL